MKFKRSFRKNKSKNRTKKRRTNKKIFKMRGGEDLSKIPAAFIELPPLSSLDKYQSGGEPMDIDMDIDMDVPPNWGQLQISMFKITDENLLSFKRIIKAPMDCVINALQIIGILDYFTSNIFRISHVGNKGFTIEQLEKVFSLRYGHYFTYKACKDFDAFTSTVINTLQPGCVMFCGEIDLDENEGHAFLIGRFLDGRYVKIDPQNEFLICELIDDECFSQLTTRKNEQYRILCHYENKFTLEQARNMGFML